MKRFTASVDVIEKRNMLVVFTADKEPTKSELLDRLKNEDYDDVVDENSLEIQSIEKIELIEEEECEEENED